MGMFDPSQRSVSTGGWLLFVAGITFALFAVFMAPIMVCWTLAFDQNVEFFMGRYAFWWTLPIPIIFLAMFLIQTRMLKPKRTWIMACWIVPSCVIFLVGGSLRFKASSIADFLLASDCGKINPTIRALDLAYLDATEKYAQCNDPASAAKMRAEDKAEAEKSKTKRRMFSADKKKGKKALFFQTRQRWGHNQLLQSCSRYEYWHKEDGVAKRWDYLQFLESNYECTGFCRPGKDTLWTYGEANGDPCALVVAMTLQHKVVRQTTFLMAYPIIILFCFILWMNLIRPTLQILSKGTPHFDQRLPREPAQEVVPNYDATRSSPGMFQPAPAPLDPMLASGGTPLSGSGGGTPLQQSYSGLPQPSMSARPSYQQNTMMRPPQQGPPPMGMSPSQGSFPGTPPQGQGMPPGQGMAP